MCFYAHWKIRRNYQKPTAEKKRKVFEQKLEYFSIMILNVHFLNILSSIYHSFLFDSFSQCFSTSLAVFSTVFYQKRPQTYIPPLFMIDYSLKLIFFITYFYSFKFFINSYLFQFNYIFFLICIQIIFITFFPPMNYTSSFQQPFQTQSYYNIYDPSQISSGITRSRLLDQNKYEPNKPLYEPLRNAVSQIPQRFQFKQYENMNAAKSSNITHEFRPISLERYEDIRANTYMIEQPLRPTSNIDKVENKNYYILNSNQKYGSPINEIQIRSRLAASREKGQKKTIIYQPERYMQTNTTQYFNQIPKINQIPPMIQPQPSLQERKIYVSTNPSATKKKKTEKYNLYSCLDQPFERYKLTGCKGMTCPSNQCIATREGYDWQR